MTQNKFTFESENLVVDYLSLSFTDTLDSKKTDKIADYLSDKGFEVLWNNQLVKSSFKNKFEASVWTSKKTSKSTIRFAGKNANHLYKLLNKKIINWDEMYTNSMSLSRLDFHYLRILNTNETKESLKSFMENSKQKVTAHKSRKAEWYDSGAGLILKIGHRGSSHFFRVYQKINSLEFELEIKRKAANLFQDSLFSNNFKEFEDRAVRYFYNKYFNILVIDTCFTDWLLISLRKTSKPRVSMVSNYLKSNSFGEDNYQQLLLFLKFLSFIRGLYDGLKSTIDYQIYYVFEFPVADFLNFLNLDPTNYYQRKKILMFLKELKAYKPLEIFSDSCYSSSIMFPTFRVNKTGRAYTVTISVAEELYKTKYPFLLPDLFRLDQRKSKYKSYIQAKLIESMCQYNLEKIFDVQDCISLSSISNQKLTTIKNLIIELFQNMVEQGFIENKFKLVRKDGSFKFVSTLNTLGITKTEYIYFYETIHFDTL